MNSNKLRLITKENSSCIRCEQSAINEDYYIKKGLFYGFAYASLLWILIIIGINHEKEVRIINLEHQLAHIAFIRRNK